MVKVVVEEWWCFVIVVIVVAIVVGIILKVKTMMNNAQWECLSQLLLSRDELIRANRFVAVVVVVT